MAPAGPAADSEPGLVGAKQPRLGLSEGQRRWEPGRSVAVILYIPSLSASFKTIYLCSVK